MTIISQTAAAITETEAKEQREKHRRDEIQVKEFDEVFQVWFWHDTGRGFRVDFKIQILKLTAHLASGLMELYK